VIGHQLVKRFAITEGDPTSASGDYRQTYELERGDWRIRIETHTVFRGTRTDWVLAQELKVFEADAEVFSKVWTDTVPRDLM
jgi:hypothetical protein